MGTGELAGAGAGRVALGILAAGALLAGCERIVDVDIPAPEPRLVVEGRIELVKNAPSGTQRIMLSTTDAFFADRLPPPAVGARVVVTDGSGGVFPFVEAAPGHYVTEHLQPRLGETYTLSIQYGGDAYRASALLREVAPIDSLYFVFEEKTLLIDEAGFRAAIDFVDPVGVPNFYLWEQFVEGVNEIPPDPGNAFNLVSRDELYDGQDVIGFQPNGRDRHRVRRTHGDPADLALETGLRLLLHRLRAARAREREPVLRPARERTREHRQSGRSGPVRVRLFRSVRGEHRRGGGPGAGSSRHRCPNPDDRVKRFFSGHRRALRGQRRESVWADGAIFTRVRSLRY